MKKVLFATTALIATAGFANAQIIMSGSAEMGLVGGDSVTAGAVTDLPTQFSQNVDISFDLRGMTDGGIAFGADVDLDESAGIAGPETDDGGASVFISGNFGTLTMGDTDGALDAALTEAGNVGNPGSLNDAETGHAGYQGSYGDGSYDGQIVRYDYTFGDFGVHVSAEIDDTDTVDNGYAVAMTYGGAFGGFDLNAGLGYQTFTTDGSWNPGNLGTYNSVGGTPPGVDIDILGASVSIASNGFSAGFVYTDYDTNNAVVTGGHHTGIGLGYSMNAISVHANYGIWELETVGGDLNASGYGIAAAYDLGGGAEIRAGYGHSEFGDISAVDDSSHSYSLGVAMSF